MLGHYHYLGVGIGGDGGIQDTHAQVLGRGPASRRLLRCDGIPTALGEAAGHAGATRGAVDHRRSVGGAAGTQDLSRGAGLRGRRFVCRACGVEPGGSILAASTIEGAGEAGDCLWGQRDGPIGDIGIDLDE